MGQSAATDSSRAAQRWVYGYDALDRLVAADNLGDDTMDQSWSYDIAGNITYNSALGSYSYPAPTAARPYAPTSVGGQAFAYDAAGNMTQGLEGRTIAYDAANRPVQVSWRGTATDYRYGPDGARVKKLTPAGTTLHPGDAEVTPQGRTDPQRVLDPSSLHCAIFSCRSVGCGGALVTSRDV